MSAKDREGTDGKGTDGGGPSSEGREHPGIDGAARSVMHKSPPGRADSIYAVSQGGKTDAALGKAIRDPRCSGGKRSAIRRRQ